MGKIIFRYLGNAKLGIYIKKWGEIIFSESIKEGKVILLSRDNISRLKHFEYYQIESPKFLELEKCIILSGKISPAESSVVYSFNKNHYETVPVNIKKQQSGFYVTSKINMDEDFHIKEIKQGDLIVTKEEELNFSNKLSDEQAILFEKFKNGSLKKISGDYYTEGNAEETEKILISESCMDSDWVVVLRKFRVDSPVYYVQNYLYDDGNYYFLSSLSNVGRDGFHSIADRTDFEPKSLELTYIDSKISYYGATDMYHRGSSERYPSNENFYIGEWNGRLYKFLTTRDGWQVMKDNHEEVSEQLSQFCGLGKKQG